MLNLMPGLPAKTLTYKLLINFMCSSINYKGTVINAQNKSALRLGALLSGKIIDKIISE